MLTKVQAQKSERPWMKQKVAQICEELKMDGESFKIMNRQLYTNLLAYTKGTARAKTISNKKELALESFRYITFKGMNASVAHKILIRDRVQHPDYAKSNKEVEAKIMEWRTNMNYLIEVGDAPFPDEILKTTLLGMVPDKVADFAIQKYDECDTMEDMEAKMMEYIDRMDQREQKARKPLGALRGSDEDQEAPRGGQKAEGEF